MENYKSVILITLVVLNIIVTCHFYERESPKLDNTR